MSFWEFLWFMFVSFCFVAYLMVMFSILVDLFRDVDISGWVKAIWVVTLIFVPLITSVVYLIARGRGMSERQTRHAELTRSQQDAYIRETVGRATPADQITQARALLEQGAISPAEYDRLKEQALGGTGPLAAPRAV